MESFRCGRDFAAWLGRVSKAGQSDIRRLLIIGAMSRLNWLGRKIGLKPDKEVWEGDDPNGQNDRTSLGQENQLSVMSIQARRTDLDLLRRSPYRQAASVNAASIGLTEDRTRSHALRIQNLLHNGRQPQKTLSSCCVWAGKG